MLVLVVTLVFSLAITGHARDYTSERECCKIARGFKECKRQCEEAWVKSRPGTQLQLAYSLPRVCPSHLVSLWKCLNSSIKGLHLYTNSNLYNHGRSCCLLAIHESCREACFTTSDVKELQQKCHQQEEKSLLRCLDRNEASKKCCSTSSARCKKACQVVFSSEKEPSKKKLRLVRRKCGRQNRHVFQCVKNVTGSVKKSQLRDHKCCALTDKKKCRDVCREVMSSKKPGDEKMMLLKKSCDDYPFYHVVWICFLNHAVSSTHRLNDGKQSQDHRTDVRLHCCLRAKTPPCSQLCFRKYMYSSDGSSVEQFYRRCEFNPHETAMLTCIADVSMPCHIGCSGLGFCAHFNHRHTELFRSCNKEADAAAKSDFENWWKKRRVEIPAMDVIPVKNIKKCLPNFWKAVACVLQIKPCHAKSHGSAICRKDCLKVLGECAEKEQLGVRTVEKICKNLSPDDTTSCISLENYLEPSLYKNETNEVTHPCYSNPCKNKDVCEINREFTGRNHKNFVPYRCTPGCSIGLQSKLIIKNGDFARLPIVQNSKLEGCFKICRCDQARLSDCPRLPSCVRRKPCEVAGTKREIYNHEDKFYVNCNFCVCFDGERFCSNKQCLPGLPNNGTGRPRRNHLPKTGDSELSLTDLPCSCSTAYKPVCGTNGKTYRNRCFARCARFKNEQILEGECSSLNPCDSVTCGRDKFCAIDRKICVGTKSFCQQHVCVPVPRDCNNVTTERICDTENHQHFNKCSLYANGREIAYSGLCKSACAPGKHEVCGVDGRTYSSSCALNHAHMLMDYEGPCRTVGKYTNDGKPTVRCAYIKCPVLVPKKCIGVTPPGACCKVCASQLLVLFSEEEVSKTNKIVMLKTQPITQEQVVSRVRRHLSVSECDLFGFYNTYGDFVLLVKAITKNPTKLQFLVCNKEAQKIETLIHTASPMFTSDEILSSFRAVSLTTPRLSEQFGSADIRQLHCFLLLIPFLVALLNSWLR